MPTTWLNRSQGVHETRESEPQELDLESTPYQKQGSLRSCKIRVSRLWSSHLINRDDLAMLQLEGHMAEIIQIIAQATIHDTIPSTQGPNRG